MGEGERKRLVALLDSLAGPGNGAGILRKLLVEGVKPGLLAERISASPALESLYKKHRTLDIGVDGVHQADDARVGLPPPPPGQSFRQRFRRQFRPRLARRAEGFTAIFDALAALPDPPLILETGCLRIPGNWDGDGQSTFMFDAFACAGGGAVISIDITPDCIESARRACSSATHLILNDSVAALHMLAGLLRRRASLLYLDSFDVIDHADPMPSAVHHALELAAARPLLGPGTIVAVDDYGLNAGGKGMLLDRFFAAIRAEVLYSGYQKVWRIGG